MTIGTHTGGHKRAVERSVVRALHKGLRPEESTGNLRWYFDHLHRFAQKDAIIRIYGNHVYMFQEDTLIAVYTLPREYQMEIEQVMAGRC